MCVRVGLQGLSTGCIDRVCETMSIMCVYRVYVSMLIGYNEMKGCVGTFRWF